MPRLPTISPVGQQSLNPRRASCFLPYPSSRCQMLQATLLFFWRRHAAGIVAGSVLATRTAMAQAVMR
jgi:hypothetical protein